VPVLDDLVVYLQAQGLGTPAVSLFNGGIPEDAAGSLDEVLALMTHAGLPPTYIHDKAAPDLEQPAVQVLIRGGPYGDAVAQQRAQQAFVALASVHNQTLNGTFYLWVRPLQSPFKLRMDELHRPIIVFNLLCAKSL
jgi:hypothetical protein